MNNDQLNGHTQDLETSPEEAPKERDGLAEFESFFAELQVFDAVTETMMCPPSPKRPRRTYDDRELDRLEKVFAGNSYPDREHRAALAKEMGVSPKHVQIWFQNRRARERILRRKAEGIVENPIDRMRSQLTHLPSFSLQQTSKAENTGASKTATAMKSSIMSNNLIQSTETSVSVPQQQQRIPLRTIGSCSNVYHQALDMPETCKVQLNSINSFSQTTFVQQSSMATALPPVTDISQIHPLQTQQQQTPQSSPFSKPVAITVGTSSTSYRVTFGSISNLSDISNSSFTELMSAIETDELLSATDPINDYFSPNIDNVFDF